MPLFGDGVDRPLAISGECAITPFMRLKGDYTDLSLCSIMVKTNNKTLLNMLNRGVDLSLCSIMVTTEASTSKG